MRIKRILTCVLSIISGLVFLDCSPKKNIAGASNDHIPEKFAKYQEPVNKSTEYIKTGWYMLNRSDSGVKRVLDKTNEIFFVDPDQLLLMRI
ncbi:MAG: hypothetical protein IPN60_07745 [Saprospiraceae bacterium]|nr:hypothetical protein [Candidatus Opimibacter skivensis]